MSHRQLQDDLGFLAGSLSHRGANTHNERRAAEYILKRLGEHAPDVDMDDFESMENPLTFLASCYGEYAVVMIVALFVPEAALVYAAIIFALYLAEISGYATLSRLLPRFETQNVAAHFYSPNPKRLAVVTAHYDSAPGALPKHPRIQTYVRWIHLGLLCCMAAVTGSCLAQALGVFSGHSWRPDLVVGWGAAALLLAAAAILLYASAAADPGRGANDNASGVAAMLQLAAELESSPLEETDVMLVATGSGQGWLNGMRRLFQTHRFDKEETLFLSLNAVGHGRLACVTGEGLAQVFRPPLKTRRTATALAQAHGAEAVTHRGWPTDLVIPLARGYRALGITALPEDAPGRADDRDSPWDVRPESVKRAAVFARALLHAVDAGELDSRRQKRSHGLKG